MSTATSVVSVATPMARQPGGFAGTGSLIRFALRRDRLRLTSWIGGIAFYGILVAAVFPGVYPDALSRQARAALMSSPGAIAFGGPRVGINDYTIGAMMTNEMLGLTTVLIALMSIWTVVRHTRADEESGRTELVRAAPVGRHAPLAAGLAVATLANLVLAVVTAVGMASLGVESIDWAGSWTYGGAYAAVGLVFAGLAAVTAQLTEHGRAASALAALGLGVAFTLRAIGDNGVQALSWLSPIGWAQRTYAFVDNRFWPLLIALAVAVALSALGFALGRRRDFGSGLRQPRPGPGVASGVLASLPGLAARLQRTTVVGWGLTVFVFGVLYGSILNEVTRYAEDTPIVRSFLGDIGKDMLLDSFLSIVVQIIAMVVTIYAIMALLRAQADERSGRAEALLATATSRSRWLLNQAGVAIAGGAVVLLAGAVGMGLSGSVATGDYGILRSVTLASLVHLAPMALFVGIAAAFYGLLPSATGAVWAVLGYGFFVAYFGVLLDLPQWAMDISPFTLVPLMPSEEFTLWPVLGTLAGAVVLLVAGGIGLRRRDIQSAG